MACLAERVNKNCDEKQLTGVVLLDVAQVFDTMWVKGLL
jgi:hypothetical protein